MSIRCSHQPLVVKNACIILEFASTQVNATSGTYHNENISRHSRVKLRLRLKVWCADRSIEVSRADLGPSHGDTLHFKDV